MEILLGLVIGTGIGYLFASFMLGNSINEKLEDSYKDGYKDGNKRARGDVN